MSQKNMNIPQIFGFTNEIWNIFGLPTIFSAVELGLVQEANITFNWSVKNWVRYNWGRRSCPPSYHLDNHLSKYKRLELPGQLALVEGSNDWVHKS